MLKRWWKFVLVITLALSLTSCTSKKQSSINSSTAGPVMCTDPNWGSYAVYTTPMPSGSGNYQVEILPMQVQTGDLVSISLMNAQEFPRSEIPSIAVTPNQEIDFNVTISDLETYPLLAITPYDGTGTPLYQQNLQYAAVCQIPQPGDVTASGTNFY